jgi:hypothetical protein
MLWTGARNRRLTESESISAHRKEINPSSGEREEECDEKFGRVYLSFDVPDPIL